MALRIARAIEVDFKGKRIMDKLRRMSKDIFQNNFVASLLELLQCSNEEILTYKFIITPVLEANKKYNSKDDFMRLLCFNEKRIQGRTFGLEETVKLFSMLNPLYPLWIEVSIYDKNDKMIELRHSLRFRKPSQIQNVDTGHPPFRVVI